MSARSLLAVTALLASAPAMAIPASPNQPTTTAVETQAAPRKLERTRPSAPTPSQTQRQRQLEAPGAALMLIPASHDGDTPMGFLPL